MKISALLLSAIVFASAALPAQACLSCGCGGSGSSADLGSIGGASSLFTSGRRWLFQSGGSFRQITGSFNQSGTWNPPPTDSLLQSYVAVLGVNYFALPGLSFGLQVPVQGNTLSGASWGSFGSIGANDLPTSFGAGLGDIQLQTSYKFLEGDTWALAGWGSLSLPTGRVDAESPWNTTGSGIPGLSAGLIGLLRPEPTMQFEIGPETPNWWENPNWELLLNLGYAQAIGTPPVQASPFFLGQSFVGQLQGNLVVGPGLVAGLGLNTQLGSWTAGPDQTQLSARVRLVPSLQYEFNPDQGLRFAVGADLPALGANTLTDAAAYLVYYQFFE
ncbi:MAG: hypothetical protein ACO1RX_17315 [Candidatus Sericytochromatia bacterium]